ncbi:MAG TPA: hybrid sensor histidine kinase/response regulator [Ktedonobacteraceae bacterium]|jgi:two-component system sensor histidine kinase/response regulator|nr:hybrid sensor histidine kinase/response regulator [Ktedonobacteraceae bacterium]
MANSRILIVDDDHALLQALPQAIALRMKDVKVDTSDSAAEALQQTQQHDYDAIISDIKMPGMDGLALIERLHVLRPDTPNLLITGHGERDLAIQALRLGAYDFIQKPIDRDYFISSLQRAIQTRRMRRQIAEQQRALEEHARSLEQAVAERTRELVEANAAKDVFMSMVSHELKTPLTTIKGVIQLLLRRVERGERIEMQSLLLLEGSARRMELLVNDLLNTSLLETGMFSLSFQRCDLVSFCQELLAEYREVMGPYFQLEILTPAMEVEMDRDRIGQVILNLLSNARKYSPPGSPITVRIARQGDQAAISVEDHGVGIPPEKLAHIFERFYRVPEVTVQTGRSAGVGLGLYIAQKIVEHHNGCITATSTPGKGSTFTIHLPLLPESEQTVRKDSASALSQSDLSSR